MIPVITRSILHLRQMTWKQLIRNMKKWDASASKIRQWHLLYHRSGRILAGNRAGKIILLVKI